MGYRKVPLVNGCFYHVFNKSIAGFEIFRYREEYLRMLEALRFYRTAVKGESFSLALRDEYLYAPEAHGPKRVRVLAYCIMPTHLHLFLEQVTDDGITDFMRYATGGYTKYFNLRAKRKGPLWEARFERRLVETDAYALHLARYIHLNPTSANLVEKPEDWEFSSYREYLGRSLGEPLCEFKHVINTPPETVRRFTEDRVDYQRSLQIIKGLMLD
jgi:putative transposase